MTEPIEQQRYYRVCAPVAVFKQPTQFELTGIPPEPRKPGELPDVVDAGHVHYNSRVPLTATAEQIAHNLECQIITEVSEEEWHALPTDTSQVAFVRTPEDEQRRQAQIARSYS
ncbi:hypothetical protein HQO84_05400 [Rhodococcus fascians]|nr:hypothetical protein [Rhodococcus fascians]MBY3999578.1 hypothetical protein [Rhodococcus fascians]MBY4001210.1 hypothetical protein [Rhodococcus fascians]MBY4009521.1 hypothetical protein [Rhodococcus fascians]MBY4015368.1 hypothetical protein [Rhodococcus fascians]